MIEKDVEKIVCDKMAAALSAAGVADFKIYGAWQTVDADEVKSSEGREACIVTVKALPRSYETPTIPQTSIQIEVSLLCRADEDYAGVGFVAMSEAVMGVCQSWHASYRAAAEDFAPVDGFYFAGFSMDGGNCGLDRDACVWQMDMTLTVHGVVEG